MSLDRAGDVVERTEWCCREPDGRLSLVPVPASGLMTSEQLARWAVRTYGGVVVRRVVRETVLSVEEA